MAPTHDPAMAPEYLSIRALSVYLGISPNTIRDWRKQGILPPAYLLGRAVRYRLGDISAWVQKRREKAFTANIRTCYKKSGDLPSRRAES